MSREIQDRGRLNRPAAFAAAPMLLLLAGCVTVGPDYKKPDAAAPPAFKELQGWKSASPAETADKGAWWSVYHDPELDRLERMVDVSNQTVKSYEAQYRAAVAAVGEARAGLFPTATLTPGLTRGNQSAGGGEGRATNTIYSLTGSTNWDLDVWGRIRRQVEANVAAAQVSAADLANAKLSAQATLATDYFDLRAEDALATLLTETAAAYRRALAIVENQYRAGTTASTDVATARAQLQSAEAQLVGVGVQRQQYEHAIAMLTGHAPSEITIPPKPLAIAVPVVPAGVPSALLERRPDIAAAERQMRQENALIGVQIAAYYPDVTLSGQVALDSIIFGRLFNAASRVWSLGAAAGETLFSGGARPAAVEAARANYDQAVATYRQTVLTGLQQVEDALSTLRTLERQAAAEAVAVDSARKAVEVTLNAYRAGTVAYTSVITEQTLLLADQQTALSIQQSRLVASVSLIQALGGGWSSADLPGGPALLKANRVFP
jgi:NodT family efflux transporter outer membrane factor (OMF) lipoprotein